MAEAAKKSEGGKPSRMSLLKGRLAGTHEKIVMSDTAIRIGQTADELKNGFLNGCGFCAWNAGKLFGPLKRAWRERVNQYHKETGE